MNHEIELTIQILLATFVGGMIGFERNSNNKNAGIRTYSVVCLGSCAFAIISGELNKRTGTGDIGRLASSVIQGIGFLGAGVIMKDNNKIIGITTASTIWATAAVGLAFGFGLYFVAGLCAVCILGVLISKPRNKTDQLKDLEEAEVHEE